MSLIIDEISQAFIDADRVLDKYYPNVTIFGSARVPQNSPAAQTAYQLAYQLSNQGVNVITGGGPGIMEAANRGAFDGRSVSIGLNIELPEEQEPNRYLNEVISFEHFFIRKVMLIKHASACVFFDGGFGTADELFELLTLIQTQKIKRMPLYLVGVDFWKPLMDWLHILAKKGLIDSQDLALMHINDDIDEVERSIYQNKLA